MVRDVALKNSVLVVTVHWGKVRELQCTSGYVNSCQECWWVLHRFQNCLRSSTQLWADNGFHINVKPQAKCDLFFTVEIKLLWASALQDWTAVAQFYKQDTTGAIKYTCASSAWLGFIWHVRSNRMIFNWRRTRHKAMTFKSSRSMAVTCGQRSSCKYSSSLQ